MISSKRPPSTFLEHEIDVQALVRHVAGPQIDIEISVVVDITKVRAHRGHGPVEPDLACHIAEAG